MWNGVEEGKGKSGECPCLQEALATVLTNRPRHDSEASWIAEIPGSEAQVQTF